MSFDAFLCRTSLVLLFAVGSVAQQASASQTTRESARESARESSKRDYRKQYQALPSKGRAPAMARGHEPSTEANKGSTEFFHQAPSARIEVTPGISYFSGSGPTRSGGKASWSGLPLQVKLEYGFSPLFSVALNLKFASIAYETCAASGSCQNVKVSGFFDPNVDLKFRVPLEIGVLRYGGNIAYAVEKRRTEISGDYNNATGGSSMTPYIGYEMPLSGGRLGVKLSYDLYMGDSPREYGTSSFTVSGGKALILTPFYELASGAFTYGGALSYKNVAEHINTTNGQAASNNDAYTAIELQAYMPIRSSPSLTYLPIARYTMSTYSSPSYTYSSVSEFQLGCDFRILF